MADIKGQLIKDSYNYVLQADIATGVVYRIGGAVPTNLIFQSGITVNGSFTYSDGTQQNGYVLTCDSFGNSSWKPVSAATPSSGVTSITVGNGLSANTTTGNVTIVFTGNTGVTGDFLPLSGGTVTGNTTFTSGLTANTFTVGPTPSLYTTTSTTVTTGTNTIYAISKTLYNSIFIDYSLSGSTGKRAGTIVGIWDGSNIEYNETSTVDIGNTSDVVFSLSLSTTANLVATISSSTWLIKTIIKSI